MALPLIPLVALAAIALGVTAATKSSSAPKGATVDNPPASGGYELDANMPPAVQAQVLQALQSQKDPNALTALAQQMAAQGYPLAANALRIRASMLSVPIPQSPTLPTTPPANLPPPPPPAGTTPLQQAALAMNSALDTNGYRQSDQPIYAAFQQAAGLTADAFPGTGTMNKLREVLATMSVAMADVPIYPWLSGPGYDGANAPLLSEWQR